MELVQNYIIMITIEMSQGLTKNDLCTTPSKNSLLPFKNHQFDPQFSLDY